MDDKQKLQLKHKDKLKGAFTHEEVKEKLKKRCIDAIKEKRKNDIEKARNNNNNRTTNSTVNTNIKSTLQDELMKLKNENHYHQNNNTVYNNNSESTTPSSSNKQENNEIHYGNSIEFEDLDFEIDEDDIFDANREVNNNIDQISNGQDTSHIDSDFDFMFTLSPEEELQLLAEIQEDIENDIDNEDESVKLYHEMERLANQEIEYFISTNKK